MTGQVVSEFVTDFLRGGTQVRPAIPQAVGEEQRGGDCGGRSQDGIYLLEELLEAREEWARARGRFVPPLVGPVVV